MSPRPQADPNGCPKGHTSGRYAKTTGDVQNGKCIECRKEQNKKLWGNMSQTRRMKYSSHGRAKKDGITWSLTLQDIRTIWPKDNCCPIFGTPFTSGRLQPDSPTIDRVRNDVGYVPGNIAIISLRANIIKSAEHDPNSIRKVADWLEKELAVRTQKAASAAL